MRTDIFLTHGYFIHEDEKEQKIQRPYPPLGLLYLSAYLKEQELKVYLHDSTFSSIKNLYADLLRIQPVVVGLYANLMTKVNNIRIIQFIKENLPDTKIILGGPDVTYNQENYLKNGADFLVIGEGEQSMAELSQALLQNSDFSSISGISYLKNNELIQQSSRVKIKDLSTLPLPDRSSIDFEKYLQIWKVNHGMRTANISTQRGCPYTCKWCSTAVYGQSYRRRPAQLVVEEILELQHKFGVEALWFVDDVFTVSHKWINELHAAFKQHQLIIPFEIITRAERLNSTVLQQLKEMGCFRIWIGAESGSQRIIDAMDRRVDIQLVQEQIIATQKIGMEAGTFIMVGYPGETLDDIVTTAEYLKNCKPQQLTITRTYPIKGTSLFNEIEDELIHPKEDWSNHTDRDLKFKTPYSDRYYENAIRYIMNSYGSAKATNILHKFKAQLKASLAYQIMKRG